MNHEIKKAQDFLNDSHLSLKTRKYLKVLTAGRIHVEILSKEEVCKILGDYTTHIRSSGNTFFNSLFCYRIKALSSLSNIH